jgi:hypothetical protein
VSDSTSHDLLETHGQDGGFRIIGRGHGRFWQTIVRFGRALGGEDGAIDHGEHVVLIVGLRLGERRLAEARGAGDVTLAFELTTLVLKPVVVRVVVGCRASDLASDPLRGGLLGVLLESEDLVGVGRRRRRARDGGRGCELRQSEHTFARGVAHVVRLR